MRFLKILFKLILIVLLVASFALEYNVIGFNDGSIAIASFDMSGTGDSVEAGKIESVTYDTIPFVGINIAYVKGDAGSGIVFNATDEYLNNNDATQSTATSPIVYLIIFFIILMIPTKRIKKQVGSRSRK
ncbi:MAG: hypothetical protein ACI4MI_03930 [Christensenellales bacterium]